MLVSMKSGLEGRNNSGTVEGIRAALYVSMKSGLEGRNNLLRNSVASFTPNSSLNEVRPRRPEQWKRFWLSRTGFGRSQ